MTGKTEQLLCELANKLNTTVEHLWGVLIKQAQVEVFNDSVSVLAIAGAMWWSFVWVKSKVEDGWDDGAWFIWSVFAFLGLLFCLMGLSEISTALLNPEYWALKQIIK